MIGKILIILLFAGSVLPQDNFIPASTCAECHEDIFNQWSKSMHRRATTDKDPLYSGMFEWAVKDTDGKLHDHCISCHSPMSTVFNLYDRQQKFNQEGITCQFCHGAKEIGGFYHAADITIDLKTIYSDNPSIENEYHVSSHRDHFANSEVCLPCHAEMSNPKGIMVCATGNEWKSYFEITGKTCLDCHMPLVNGARSHQFPGTHGDELLPAAVDMQLEYLEKERKLIIKLNNHAAGHALPTGTPLRMVFIKTVAFDNQGKIAWENWKENPMKEDPSALFMKILGNDKGEAPVPPWKATQLVMDRKLMPGKPVSVEYIIENPAAEKVESILIYRFAPQPILDKFGLTDPHFTQSKKIISKKLEIQ